MTDITRQLIKTYAPETGNGYRFPTFVSHGGTVIAFAMDAGRKIFYSVLDMSREPEVDNPMDVDYWDQDPKELRFPDEIDRIGYQVAGTFRMCPVKKNGAIACGDTTLEPKDKDLFLSTTAWLTADVPFQVLSDGKYVYVFRESVSRDHENMRFFRRYEVEVPAVDSSLLMDRFIFVNGTLNPVRDVRYQRSRNKSLPESRKDTLGYEDLEKVPFYEPTHQVTFVRDKMHGRFTVLLLPTAQPESKRWQIFAYNSGSEAIDSFNIEQGADGLFNTRGTRYYTSPDIKYRSDVFEREPGKCPFTGKDLVPVIDKKGFAEYCLNFPRNDIDKHINCGSKIDLRGSSFTIEFWAKRNGKDKDEYLLCQGKREHRKGLHIGFMYTNQLRFSFFGTDVDLDTREKYTDTGWHHWAFVCKKDNNNTVKRFIYLDGKEVAGDKDKSAYEGEGDLLIGSFPGREYFFNGLIDEVRIWKRARTQTELIDDMNYRLVGNEPDLEGCWRFDEGSGNNVYDQTDNCHHGVINGEPEWVDSDAPVGDHPGISRTRFRFKDHQVASGLSALVYSQQETAPVGYEHEAEPVKRSVRVMLASAVSRQGEPHPYVAALDFGVSCEGKLTQTREELELQRLDPDGRKDVPMPFKHIDPFGLTLYGGLLSFAGMKNPVPGAPDEGPHLFDSANRRVNLYFRSHEDWFTVAHYDTRTARAVFTLPTTDNNHPLRCIARSTGDMMDSAEITVAPGDEGTCTVTVKNPRLDMKDEIFKKVPREPQWFAAILNGEPHQRFEAVGNLDGPVSGETESIKTKKGIPKAIEAGAVLFVGKTRVTLREAAAQSATELKILKISLEEMDNTPIKRLLEYDYRANTNTTRLQQGLGSMLFVADSREAKGNVKDGSAVRIGTTPTIGCRWISDAPGNALTFAKDRDVYICAEGTAARQWAVNDDAAMEAWVKPGEIANEKACIIHHKSEHSQYSMGLFHPRSALKYMPHLQQYCQIPYSPAINPESFTVTFWAKVLGGHTGSDGYGPVISSSENAKGFMILAFNNPKKWAFSIGKGGAHQWETVYSDEDYKENTWYFVHAVYDGKTKKMSLLGNAPKTVDSFEMNKKKPMRIGAETHRGENPDFFFNGEIDEVRIWNRVLSDTEIEQLKYRRLNRYEREDRSLVGCWRLIENGRLYDYSRYMNHGDRVNNPEPALSPLFACYAGVGDQYRQADMAVNSNEWNHLAASFNKAYALKFVDTGQNGQPCVLDCGKNISLDLCENLTVEVSCVVEKDNAGILSKAARINAEKIENVPYSLYVNADRTLGFAFKDRNHVFHEFKSEDRIKIDPGEFYKIAVSRERKIDDKQGGAVWYEICFYINGQAAGSHRYDGASPGGGDGELKIGYALSSYNRGLSLVGRITEVSIWDTARSGKDINSEITGNEKGLISWWRFREGEGNIVRDEKSSNHGTIHHCQWVDSPDPDASQLKMYLNGEEWYLQKSDITFNADPQFTLGACKNGSNFSDPFSGQLDEIRIWNTARTPEQIQDNLFRKLTGDRHHLVAYYDCEKTGTAEIKDQSGRGARLTAKHFNGVLEFENNDACARIENASHLRGFKTWEMWFSPDQCSEVEEAFFYKEKCMQNVWKNGYIGIKLYTSSGWREYFSKESYKKGEWYHVAAVINIHGESKGFVLLYINGNCMGSWGAPDILFSDRPWLLGISDGPGKFMGKMYDLRIWNRPLNGDEIKENMYIPLKGNEDGLVGYWPLHRIEDNKLKDKTTYQNDAAAVKCKIATIWRPVSEPEIIEKLYVDSTAPVSDETAKVRGALGAMPNHFHDTIESRPAVREYSDIQQDSGGQSLSVLKRCYGYIKNRTWHLLTGFKVGDLEMEWIGQAQYDPQLVGFIEGAPPVPGENLTRKQDYSNASTVELSEADDVIHTYSTSRGWGLDTYISGQVGGGFKSKSLGGVGIMTSVEELKVIAGVKYGLETSHDWLTSSEVSEGKSTNKLSKLAVQGEWSEKGKRFVPLNVGFALVQSETADIFALRLKHPDPGRRALVAFHMQPNPDIPRDWNIIVFPLNPLYTKQGTLDGRLGLKPDEHYPHAGKDGFLYNSYYKPLEAYRMKNRIEREEEELKNFYTSFSPGNPAAVIGGLVGGAAAGGVVTILGPILSPLWGLGVAAGGIIGHAATMSGLPQLWSRNMVNSYVWTADGGFFAETEKTMTVRQEVNSGGFSLKGKAGIYVDADITITKTNLTASMEAMLGGHFKMTTQAGENAKTSFALNVSVDGEHHIRDANGKKEPGKVDAYRFMSFYLQPGEDHFEDFANKVVDPIWLASADPNAIALKQAVDKKNGEPWRVLHRITYVSRVLPEKGEPGSVEEALRAANIESNYELIKRIEPYVSNKTHNPTEFREAVLDAIRRHLPELDKDNIRERILQYMCAYFQVESGNGD